MPVRLGPPARFRTEAPVPILVNVADDVDVWPAVKEKRPLTCGPLVELPGIETDTLPGNLASDLTVSFRFGPVQYSSLPALSFWGLDGVKGNARAGTPGITPVPVAGAHAARVVSE